VAASRRSSSPPTAPASTRHPAERNRKDIIEIPDQPKKEIEILFVKRMDELLPLVLTEMPKLGAHDRARHDAVVGDAAAGA